MDRLESVQVKTGKVKVLLISSDASGSEGKLWKVNIHAHKGILSLIWEEGNMANQNLNMNEPKLPKNNDWSFSCMSCKTVTLSKSKVMVISIRHCTRKER